MPNNFRISVISDDEEHLKMALQIGLDHREVVAWSYHTSKGLILYWIDSNLSDVHKFPAPIKRLETLFEFIKDWLISQNYGPEPDHDGSNRKGFHVYNEAWGHVDGKHQALLAIKPEWLMYGK